MINEIVKLTAPKNLETFFQAEDYTDNEVIIRPTYLSICAADQRYYQGKRKKAVLAQKLPLGLIHEGIGEIVYDKTKQFSRGEKVVMIPNIPKYSDPIIKENYLPSSRFRSSTADGFMQNVVYINKDRIIPIRNIHEQIGSFIELCSVAVNAIENFNIKAHSRRDTIGVWGCGSVGYITTLLLKNMFPKSKIIAVGTSVEKLSFFSFADEIQSTIDMPSDFKVDHAFECVGGTKSEDAINQIIDHINPQGCISLLGVSETNIGINTRMVLEKGLCMLGNSRSGYSDFKKAIEIAQNEQVQSYLMNIISDCVNATSINDINSAFNKDLNNSFKTVMKWNL